MLKNMIHQSSNQELYHLHPVWLSLYVFYRNWQTGSGQPDMSGDCVVLGQSLNFEWDDITCTETHRYICQKPGKFKIYKN